MRSFVGAQTAPVAPPFKRVNCLAFAPSASATQSCPPETYATCRPSGDHRASVALASAVGNARGFALDEEDTKVVAVRRLLPTSVVRTVYRIRDPSGDGCGSLTARTAAKSSNVIVRFCCAPAS